MPSVKGQLVNGCRQPVILPQKELNRREVEDYWSRDRVALSSCYANTQAYQRNLDNLENSFSLTGK